MILGPSLESWNPLRSSDPTGLGTMQRIARSDTKMESSGISESTMMWQWGVSRVGSLCHQKPNHVELYCHVSRSSTPPAPPAKMLKVWWIVSPHLRKLQDWRQFKKKFRHWRGPCILINSFKFTEVHHSKLVINARCHALSWNLQKHSRLKRQTQRRHFALDFGCAALRVEET